jgi:hypothetical protein
VLVRKEEIPSLRKTGRDKKERKRERQKDRMINNYRETDREKV